MLFTNFTCVKKKSLCHRIDMIVLISFFLLVVALNSFILFLCGVLFVCSMCLLCVHDISHSYVHFMFIHTFHLYVHFMFICIITSYVHFMFICIIPFICSFYVHLNIPFISSFHVQLYYSTHLFIFIHVHHFIYLIILYSSTSYHSFASKLFHSTLIFFHMHWTFYCINFFINYFCIKIIFQPFKILF